MKKKLGKYCTCWRVKLDRWVGYTWINEESRLGTWIKKSQHLALSIWMTTTRRIYFFVVYMM